MSGIVAAPVDIPTQAPSELTTESMLATLKAKGVDPDARKAQAVSPEDPPTSPEGEPEKPAEEKPAEEKPAEVEKPKEKPAELEAKKREHYAQRLKSELGEAHTALEQFHARDAQWQANTEVVLGELERLRGLAAFYEQTAKQHGWAPDPRDQEIAALRQAQHDAQRQSEISQRIAAQQREAQIAAQTQRVTRDYVEDIREAQSKHEELADRSILEKALNSWMRLAGDESFSKFAEEYVDRVRWTSERGKVSKVREQLQGNRAAPKTLRANGSAPLSKPYDGSIDSMHAWARATNRM